MKQGSPEWLAARCGKATASEFAAILAKGEGKTRASYLRRVLAERLTGKPTDTYRNGHMDRGQEQEPFARMAYEERTGVMVEEVGFIQHPTLQAGCSPDALVGLEGGAEIKSVIPTVQLETIMRGKYPTEHRAQIQGNIWLSCRKWWDFNSYCPDMPEKLRLYTFRVERDESYIAMLEEEVTKFLNEVDEAYKRLMEA
jgi:hypothetical protein